MTTTNRGAAGGPRTRRLEHCTWPEVRECIDRGTGVLLPVGSTEQHGYHLPLATDALLATRLGEAVSDAADLLVAPCIAYGYMSRPLTGGGQGFVGTTSLTGATLTSLVAEVLGEFLRQGFERLVVLSWHWENHNFVYEAARLALDARASPAARIVVFEAPFGELRSETMEVLFGGEFPGWGTEHAGIMETSAMLHLHPELVLYDQAVDDEAPRREWYDVLPPPDDFVPSSGTLWRAQRGSVDKGQLAWKDMVDGVTEALARDLSARG